MADLAEADVSAIADDDVVEDLDAQQRARARELTGELEILGARRGVAAGMDWAMMIAPAFARMAALNTSRGYVAAVVMWGSGGIRCTPSASLLANAT